MSWNITARWPTAAGLPSGVAVARLLGAHEAVGATSGDGEEAVLLRLDVDDPGAAAQAASTAIAAALEQHAPSSVSTRSAGHLLTSMSIEQEGAPSPRGRTGHWPFPDLVSLAEIAATAGVSRQRAQQWAKDRDDFPTPARTTSLGPLYARAATDHRLATARRGAGRPRRSRS